MMNRYASLGLWIVIFEAVSFAIGRLTQGGVDGWYATLQAPPMTPPNILFPIMWTILYALIAAAGWNIWRSGNKKLIGLFAVYMAFNWSWSFLFFTLHLLGVSFFWILAINLLSIAIVIAAHHRTRAASWLMIPPTLWTLFAAYLNGGYWILN